MKKLLKYTSVFILLVTAFAACQKNDFKSQALQPKGATAAFTFAPDPTNTNNLIFAVTSPVAGSTYHWNWGDGTYSTGATPSHIFATPGTFPVTLTLTNSAGIETVTGDAKVSATNFTLTATTTDKVEVVNSSINCTDYVWDWGDGTATANENPGSHTYTMSGLMTVKLTGKIAGSSILSSKTALVFIASKAQLAGTTSRTWKYHPTEGLSFFGSFSAQQPCELATKFIFFANNNYQCDNNGSEIVFPDCTVKPARPQTTWTLTRINLLQIKLNIGTAGASFFGDPTTGPDYNLVNLTDNLLEVDKVNFGFTDEVKYKMLKQ